MATDNAKRVMIIDGLNMYLRGYIVNPSISTNGNPIGGVVGFLGSLNKLMRELKPTQVVICWDGPGGSQKRREIVKEYKAGRKPIRTNYQVEGMNEQSQKENQVWQHSLLLEVLNEMPIVQLMLEHVEADDLISYVCSHQNYAGWQKVIVSSDKDFLQLLNEETILFRPIQKQIHTTKNVIEEFGIAPENFADARAISGDKSDNLPGISGIGLPTVAKRFPFLKETKSYFLPDILQYCQDNQKASAAYKSIASNFPVVESNYKMMNLTPPSISIQGKEKVNYALDNFGFDLNITNLKSLSLKNGFAAFDWSDITVSLRRIVSSNSKQLDHAQ